MSVRNPLPRQARRDDFAATAGQTVFGPGTWTCFDVSDVVVRLRNPGGRFVTQTSGFTVSAETPGPAIVTFASGLSAGATVRVESRRIHQRTSDITRGGALRSVALERELDLQSTVLQELRRDADDVGARALQVPEGETAAALPAAADRALKTLAFDAGGAPVALPVPGLIGSVTRAQIIDSGATGKDVMAATTQAEGRSAIGAVSAADLAGAEVRAQTRLERIEAADLNASPEACRWAFYENGSVFPGIVPWQDSTNTPVPITDAFIDATIDEHRRYGIDRLVWIKAEQYGFAMFPFSFTPWDDQQSNRPLQNWQNASPPGWIPTPNPILRALDRAAQNGFKIVIGLGKNGDDYLALDLELAGATVSAATSAALAAIPKATRTATAIARGCQMAQDLFTQFGSHPGFAGFYVTHEPSAITACTGLMKGIISDGGGGFPPAGSWRLPDGRPVEIWVSPGDIDDFPAANAGDAAWEAYAAQLRSWGATHCVWQDAVGSGEDINNLASWNPANRLSMLRGYAASLARLQTIVNAASLSSGKGMLFGWNNELFQMDGPGYDNAYPAAGARVADQIAKTADRASYAGFYGVFPYAMRSIATSGGAVPLQLPQNWNGKTDYRTRADSLGAYLTAFLVDDRERKSGAAAAAAMAYEREDLTARSAPAGATTSFTVGDKIYPQGRSTRHLVTLTLWVQRAHQAPITGVDVTLTPLVNGVGQGNRSGPIGVTNALLGLPITITFQVAHEGLPYSVGWSAAVLAGAPAFVVTKAWVQAIDVRG